VFDSMSGGGVRMAAARQDIQQLKAALADDPAIASPTLRCAIYARLYLWHPLFEGHGNEAEYQQWCERLGCTHPASAFRPKLEV
jgi:para-nitrobenzyl esterase